MAYTTINKSTDYFNTKLYTGNGSTNAITGVGFQPDMCWWKMRSSTEDHALGDAVRTAGYIVKPNSSDAQAQSASYFASFDSDGFTLGSDTKTNGNGSTYASWNWKANGAGSSNTDGSITSTVSANTTSGFSIVKYTGNGSNGATVGHGLGSVPAMIAVKNLGGTDSWQVYHKNSNATPEDYILQFNTTGGAIDNNTFWNDTAPTSSVFSIGTDNGVNQSSANYIAYCFAEKKGFSKFGSVKGNGSDDGPFIYTGFKPAFYMHKVYNGATGQWLMFDNKRNETNVVNKFLKTDANEAEGTSGSANQVDFLSNGIKIRENNGDLNGSTSNDYLYIAFAEAPLVGSNNVPANAR